MGPEQILGIAVEKLYTFCHLKAVNLETQKRVIKNSGLIQGCQRRSPFQGIIHVMQIYKET